MDQTSTSRSTQTEPSPQFDMACWLAKILLHMDLNIQTHPDAEPRLVRRDHPGDFFYLFAQETWPETTAALWTIFTNSLHFKAELYDMVLRRGGDGRNAIAVLYGSPAVEGGRIVFLGFTAPELKSAHAKLTPKPSEICPEEQAATTVRYEIVGGHEYMAEMAPPITRELQEKLDEAFAMFDAQTEEVYQELKHQALRNTHEEISKERCGIKPSEGGAPFVNIKDSFPHLRQLDEDLSTLILEKKEGGSEEPERPSSAPPPDQEDGIPRVHPLPSNVRYGMKTVVKRVDELLSKTP